MTGAGSAPEWGGTPMEEVGIWAMLQPEHAGQPDIPLLKESVRDLFRMTMQKTAGQRKDRRGDIPFDNLDRLKWTILMEACLLVLSGKLDALEGGAESETV